MSCVGNFCSLLGNQYAIPMGDVRYLAIDRFSAFQPTAGDANASRIDLRKCPCRDDLEDDSLLIGKLDEEASSSRVLPARYPCLSVLLPPDDGILLRSSARFLRLF